MFKFVFQFLVFLLLLLSNKHAKKTWVAPSNILFAIYAVCAALGIATLYVEDFSEPFLEKYWRPMIVFDITLLLFLLPFRLFNESKVTSIRLPSRRILDYVSSILIVLSFFSIFFYARTVGNIMSMADLGDARDAVAGGEYYVQESLLNTIASVASSLAIIALLFYFIYTVIGGNKKRRILLFISSFSEALQVLTFVGRDGIVFWLFAFAFLYALFHDYLPQKNRSKIRKTFIYISIILLIPFFAITISRFGDKEMGASGGVVSYLGQGFVNGPLLFGIEEPPLVHGASFPLFFEWTGIPKPRSMSLIQIGDWKSWTFPTFVGSFYRNFGPVWIYVVWAFMFILFFISMKNAKRWTLSNLIIYLLYYRLYSEGVFYFREYTRGGNLFILLCLSLALFFNYYNNESPIIINKQYEK